MSTPLTDRITALTGQANATTGASDTTLTDAVGTLISGYGQSELWKTVTLEEDHTTAANGVATFWKPFLEIPDDLDGYAYLVVFEGNSAPSMAVNFILYSPFGTPNARDNGSNTSFGLPQSRALYASQGTAIKIYKIGGFA